jgi:hypothetical protein
MPVFAKPAGATNDYTWQGPMWAAFIRDHRERFERIVGAPMKQILGCGVFGCVYQSDGPWVVKITRDSAEGPAWAAIADALRDAERKYTHGFLRVREIVRIHPNVVFDSKEQYVYAIVREEAQPVFTEDTSMGFADQPALSEETQKRLGITEASLVASGVRAPVVMDIAKRIDKFPVLVQKKFAQLYYMLSAMRIYRATARSVFGASPVEQATLLAEMGAHAFAIQKTPISRELGFTLRLALAHEMIFPDLHLYNLGWRSKATIDGDRRPRCMTILDPGLATTAYMPHIREAELMENVGQYLRNAGLLDIEPDHTTVDDVSAGAFYDAFESAMGPHNPYSAYVAHYSIPELADMRARYLSSTGLSGICANDHGDGRIEGTALFNEGDFPGAGAHMLQHAIEHAGVNYLECFGEGLRTLYGRNGFVVADSVPFNDEYAPKGWNYGLFGRPDYFTMKLRRQSMDTIPATAHERRAAVDEMVANPEATRSSVIESLRRKGLTDNEIRREVAIIEATIGF